MVMAGSMFLLAIASTATVASAFGTSYAVFDAVLFGPMALVFWAICLRSLFLGVVVDSDKVVARLTKRTVKIRWSEVEAIDDSGELTITWKKPDETKSRTTRLNVLASYNLLGRTKPLSKRAAADLNARLAHWRKMNAAPHPN
jgi:hypothetical protein